MCATYSYDPSSYGDNCAEFYDQIYGHPQRQLIATLASLAAGGPILEFGSATGRVAIQLARLGLDVTGIELSTEMLRVLRGKDVPPSIKVIYGDFTNVAAPGLFSLIFCIHSTMFLLPQELQGKCFENAAKHLSSGGIFLIEAASRSREAGGVTERGSHPVTPWSGTTSCYILKTTAGARNYRVTQYYSSIEDLDRIASEAGLTISERWSTWTRSPLLKESLSHISLYVHSKNRQRLQTRHPRISRITRGDRRAVRLLSEGVPPLGGTVRQA